MGVCLFQTGAGGFGRGLCAAVVMAAAGIFSGQAAQGAALHVGDIVVDAQNSGNLYAVNPISGATSLISSGGMLYNPFHLLVDPLGNIYTPERGGLDASPGIVKTIPATGGQTMLASGPLLNFPVALAFDSSGNFIAGNSSSGVNTLVRVNSQTGSQTPLATLNTVNNLEDLTVDSQGRVVALDFGYYNSGAGKIVRYDPASGQETIIASGGFLFNPSELLITPFGHYIVANGLANGQTQILDINSTTGSQSLLTTVASADWIALQDANDIVFGTPGGSTSVGRINLTTGQVQTISTFQFTGQATGVGIYQGVPEPSTALAVMALAGVSLARRGRRGRKA